MTATPPAHGRGSDARILLCSVFGPYAVDDAYGSRTSNPMELYHNQVTREQGPFSLRMFHRTFGLILIAANLDAPCTLLDFPTRERFIDELQTGQYDIVGISAIPPNVGKVAEMCRLVRQHAPGTTIVVGGHVAAMPDLPDRVDADHVVRGEGVAWFRRFIGQDPDQPITHPAVYSGFGTRTLGITLRDRPGTTAAVLIPSVGCPMGCNFCATSALFGGKGHCVNFYETGDELFQVLCNLEAQLQVCSFFVMDENFLFHRKRALRLLELIEQHDKAWAFYVFSSARVIESYDIEQLVALGVSWVWMGIEGSKSQYAKLSGVDTLQLVDRLQSHGIRVLGSSIIGLEDHSPENMDVVIDDAVSHNTDFHQFMLYTPVPGTPLWQEHEQKGTLLPADEFDPADAHGQYRFNYHHPLLPPGSETEYLREAFARDFRVNGPSIARLIRTTLRGWQRYKHHPDARIRRRFAWEAHDLRTTSAAAIWAMARWYRRDRLQHQRLRQTLTEIYRVCGLLPRLCAPLLGRIAYRKLASEQQRLARGWTYEPPCVYEHNARARELLQAASAQVVQTAEGMLSMQPRTAPAAPRLQVLDLQGVCNRAGCARLRERVEAFLQRNPESVAINFAAVNRVDRRALRRFLRTMKPWQDRITLISMDHLRGELADVAEYARRYFEVLSDEAALQADNG